MKSFITLALAAMCCSAVVLLVAIQGVSAAQMMAKIKNKVMGPRLTTLQDLIATGNYDKQILDYWGKTMAQDTIDYLIDLRKMRANQMTNAQMCAKWNSGGDGVRYKINLEDSTYTAVIAACAANSADMSAWYKGQNYVTNLALGNSRWSNFQQDVKDGKVKLAFRRRKHSSSLRSGKKRRV